jgi:hypothetical protein
MTTAARYRAACSAGAPVTLGLISNPLAKTNWRSVAHVRLTSLLSDPKYAISTPSVERVPEAVRELLFERGCNVLAINGGDGTIHSLVQSTIEVLANAQGGEEELPLPVFLLLNGGGMNMLARTFDTRGHPVKTVRRFLSRFEGAPLGSLTIRSVPLVEVHEPDGWVRYGFIFGSELVLNALTMYERFGQGYRGLVRLLGAISAGVVFETELWRQFGHLLSAPQTPVAVDGVTRAPYACVVVSSVPLTLVLGLIRTLSRRARPRRLEGLIIQETDPLKLVSMIPALLFGHRHEEVTPIEDASEVSLCGPYTLDGERFVHLNSEASIRVTGSRRTFRAVWLG